MPCYCGHQLHRGRCPEKGSEDCLCPAYSPAVTMIEPPRPAYKAVPKPWPTIVDQFELDRLEALGNESMGLL